MTAADHSAQQLTAAPVRHPSLDRLEPHDSRVTTLPLPFPPLLAPPEAPLPARSAAARPLPSPWRAPRHSRQVRRRASWYVLAYPDFRLYFFGSVLSNLGTWLQNTAQALLAYNLTRSAL